MFIDQTPQVSQSSSTDGNQVSPKKSKKTLLLISGGLLIIILGVGGWYMFTQKKKVVTPSPIENPVVNLPPNPISSLPNNNQNQSNNNFQGEAINFGSFYTSLAEALEIKIKPVQLPLNVKSEVSNYYTVARKLNLDSAITDLNKNGFAVLTNPFVKSGDTFFGVYNELAQRDIPLLITSDFMLYYYQNSLKEIYKEIESSYFYDSLWKVNKQLFETANGRYLDRQRKSTGNPDPLLEAERLEVAYFAVSLALLSPQPYQVGKKEDLSETSLFSPSEAQKYQFTVPTYLTDDVNQELALIKGAEKKVKSPLFLYTRDYTDFRLPNGYSSSAKLRNFYLANRWQTTLFPLNYHDDTCDTCLLDHDDWVINQITAYLISEHLSSNQDLKNEWAKIYKITSFFSGLRSGLTYLHYQDIRTKLFGSKTVEEIFSNDAATHVDAMRAEVKKIVFKPSEGGYDSNSKTDATLIGMRLLQPNYWSDQYIYSRLLFNSVGVKEGADNAQKNPVNVYTSCYNKNTKVLYRCRGFGFDILGTVTDKTPDSAYYTDNISYKDYDIRRQDLQKEFEGFTKGEWYVNHFWTTLSIIKNFINDYTARLPYTQSPAWQNRQVSTALASLTNTALPYDEWRLNRSLSTNTSLETSSGADKFHYIEINNALSDELVANTTMIFKTLAALNVVSDTDPRFRELLDKLNMMREITRQELRGEVLTANQQQFIVDVIRQYSVSQGGDRSRTTSFYDPTTKQTKSLRQTIGPLQLLVLLYEQGGKNILAVGPVLRYSEN